MEKEKIKKSKKLKTIDIAYIGIFAALIAVCSWISIPLAVPVTLQTMAVCIAAGLLGTKKSVLTVIVYILLGLIGVPVFSGFSSGAGVLFGITGGYIIGFIFTALIVGIMLKGLGKKVWVYALSMFIGIAVCYAFGTAWFVLYNNSNSADSVTIGAALSMCVVPFIIPDIVKIAIATLLCKRLDKHVKA
ncbi:MAG: biotin transporter BioY [Eubacterium sp.]|nr:biotin transporter BioY [Eubacterium sp.]